MRKLFIAACLCLLGLVACGDDPPAATPSPTPTYAPGAAPGYQNDGTLGGAGRARRAGRTDDVWILQRARAASREQHGQRER